MSPPPHHEVKVHQVVDAEALQHEHDVAKVGALYLGHRVGVQLVLERPRRVQPEALARLLGSTTG